MPLNVCLPHPITGTSAHESSSRQILLTNRQLQNSTSGNQLTSIFNNLTINSF